MVKAKNVQTVIVKGKRISFTDSDYVGAGGEGSVWRKGLEGFKIYHDPKKMIPAKKIQELSALTPTNVIAPKEVVLDAVKGNPIGFTFKFVENSHPLCKIFTKSFRTKVGFTEQGSVDLVRFMQQTVSQIHKEKCLIVDMNEMNFLLDKGLKIPYFIDVDSWQTPSFKATALMESVRDRLVKGNTFNEGSDWFSFAVVAFQIYIGIHPYKGMHPDFKPKDWGLRMDKGISVFDSKSILPPSVRPMSVIPPAHLKWFESVFIKNERNIPPLPDGIGMIPGIDLVVVITGNEKFEVKMAGSYTDNVLYVYNHGSENYTLTKKKLYVTSRGVSAVKDDIENYDKVLICDSPGDRPLLCKMKDEEITFEEVLSNTKISSMKAQDIMVRDGRFYAAIANHVYEVRFTKWPKEILYSMKRVCGYTENSSKMFEGVVYRDVLGQPYFTIPFRSGSSYTEKINELEDHRVLEAKSEDNIVVILAEKDGSYHRFILVFSSDFRYYTCRKVEDVRYDAINFTKIVGGPCILVSGDNEIEIFVDNKNVKRISDPPFDSSMRLFNVNGKVFFINGKEIQQVMMK